MSSLGHRTQNELDVLKRPAESLPPSGSCLVSFVRLRRDNLGKEPGNRDLVFPYPTTIGAAPRVEVLDLGVFHETVFFEVKPEYRSWFQSSVALDIAWRDVENAGLRRKDEEPVFRERPPCRPQAVAVQCRAEAKPVGEGDCGRAIPRLHKRRVVFVERADIVAHVVLCAPCLGNEHHHRVRRVSPCRDEQLEDVVQGRGVGLTAVDNGKYLLEIVAEGRRLERRFARRERGEVALDRVDFAVVRDGAEGVREFPGGERVRGVALVDDSERRDEVGIGEIGIELLYLRREEQSLVDDRARRAGTDIGVLRRFLNLAANDIKTAFEVIVVFNAETQSRRVRRDEDLPYSRHNATRIVADGVWISRHVSPAKDFTSFALYDFFYFSFLAIPAKDHRNTKSLCALCASAPHPC